jgi:predicted nicotinamide N-methyase
MITARQLRDFLFFLKKECWPHRDAHVCELGAGSSGLAGLAAAAAGAPASVLLTDGNENSVRALELVVRDNRCVRCTGLLQMFCMRVGDHVGNQGDPGRVRQHI